MYLCRKKGLLGTRTFMVNYEMKRSVQSKHIFLSKTTVSAKSNTKSSPPTAAQKPYALHSEQQPEPESEWLKSQSRGRVRRYDILRPLPVDQIPYQQPAVPASACSCLQLRDQGGRPGERSSEVEGGPDLGDLTEKGPKRQKGPQSVCKNSKLPKTTARC